MGGSQLSKKNTNFFEHSNVPAQKVHKSTLTGINLEGPGRPRELERAFELVRRGSLIRAGQEDRNHSSLDRLGLGASTSLAVPNYHICSTKPMALLGEEETKKKISDSWVSGRCIYRPYREDGTCISVCGRDFIQVLLVTKHLGRLPSIRLRVLVEDRYWCLF